MDMKKVVKGAVKVAMVADTVWTVASLANPATAMTTQLVKKGMKVAVAKKFAKNATGIIAHEAVKRVARDAVVTAAVDPIVDGAGAIVDAVAKANKKETKTNETKKEVDPLGQKDLTQEENVKIYVPNIGLDVTLTRTDALEFAKLGTYYKMVCFIQERCNLTHMDARYVCDKFQLVYKNLL